MIASVADGICQRGQWRPPEQQSAFVVSSPARLLWPRSPSRLRGSEMRRGVNVAIGERDHERWNRAPSCRHSQ